MLKPPSVSPNEVRLRAKLLKLIEVYLSEPEQQLVVRAYEFARLHHATAKRASGESYIVHPLSVAIRLAELNLDAATIAAGLLHDVCEDAGVPSETLKSEFGTEIATLVAGVTKLARVKLKKPTILSRILERRAAEKLAFDRQVESLRKMLIAMADDIRVILIKLADRLHNMETLDAVRPDKRVRIAQETLEIYAPLAYRLGMGEIKGRLEDLAFPYVYQSEYDDLRGEIEDRVSEREKYIDRFSRVVKSYLQAEGVRVTDIHGRAKHVYSLWRKLKRYQGDLSKIYDIVAIRLIVPTIGDCYHSLGLIHARWNPLLGRIKDYIATPKPNGYQSLHTTVFGLDGEISEIQIRTAEMHEQAEFGIAAHWNYSEYKHSAPSQHSPAHGKLQWLKELRRWQASLKDPKELKEVLQLDFFSDRIFVFTPQGDVIDLPADSTPVDFAYSIHSDLGNACVGSKINNKLSPLDTKLANGDIVEILLGKQPKPKRDWLRFIKSHKARSHIKSYFNL